MNTLIVLCAVLAATAASPGLLGAAPLGAAPLLPKVQVAPTEVTIVKQPITVQQPELRYRQVPVPVRAVSYAAPYAAYGAAPYAAYGAAPYAAYGAYPYAAYGAAPYAAYGAYPYAAAPGYVKIH